MPSRVSDGFGLRALVLGSAAGGGFPQWNCACRLCELSRQGDPRASARSQASVAFSADHRHWMIVGASPDLRQQLLDRTELRPRAPRQSPVFAVVLISGDVDGLAGLIALRERHRFTIFAPGPILAVLEANGMFDVLDRDLVPRVTLLPGQPVDCGHGLQVTLLGVPGKTPLYQETRGATQPEAADTYAALVECDGRRVIVAPACAEVTDAVLDQLRSAELVFFDGTLFADDEMQVAGVGGKTGRRMGHVPVGGPDGSLARLAGLPGRVVYLHINNTNPLLLEGSPERLQVEAAGFGVAHDGLEVRL